MKIELTEGCTCWRCDVDGQPYDELSEEKLREITHKLVDKCNKENLESLVWSITEMVGDYKHLGNCECCGDSISEYNLEID